MEVETPLFSPFSCIDSNVDVFSSQYIPEGGMPQNGYFQTSPEMFMKRLLCMGYPSIYQICKSFRNGEAGSQHNPEFSMLEWYRLGFSLEELMGEVEILCKEILGPFPKVEKTYEEWFQWALGWNPFSTPIPKILEYIRSHEPAPAFSSIDDLLHFCMARYVEPKLPKGSLCFVTAFPASQAALAQIHPQNHKVSLRFELYIDGIELCNGYQELENPEEYRARFEKINKERKAQKKAELKMDSHLLKDLEKGLPSCSGVALGLDRLLMLLTKSSNIQNVLSFPYKPFE